MYKHYKLRRDELYEKVWSKPMVEIAKEYEVSDKAIAKICDKLNIPVPGLGYWRKVEVGEKVKRMQLPDIRPNDPVEHTITKYEPDYELIISEEVQKKIEEEKDPLNKIVVPLKQTRYNSLTNNIKLSLKEVSRSKHFLKMTNEYNMSTIYISKDFLSRGLRIIDSLIKALEARGYLVYINNGALCVKIFGIEIKIELKEKSKRIKIQPTKTWHFNDYEFLPTNIFTLSIGNSYSEHGIQKNYGDIKSVKVEERLNDFIIGLLLTSQDRIALDILREKEDKIREERKRVEEERLAAIKNEKKKLQELKLNVENYHQSNIIRSYISEYKQKLLDDSLTEEQKKEIENYIEWALKQADRLDPFVESPPSILDNQ